MATESELAKQSVPINKIPKSCVNFVIRVLVIQKGSITPYKNSRHEGSFRTIILVDEEGTKIQAMLFNKHIETWKDSLKPNKSYYIANGRLDRVNPNYSSVHKEVELAFTNNTIIKETDHEVSTQKFSDGFSSLDNANKLPNGAILDLICVLVSVNPLIQNATFKRREIVVTNELMEHTSVTLWGDFTENDGAFLKNLKDDKSILGLCDVRVSIYKGRFGISTIPDCMYKFKTTIIDILNKDEPWYLSCKTCHKKVKVIEEVAACTNCNVDNVEYEMRIDLTDSNPRRSLISEQIHQVEDEAPIIVEKEVKSVRKYIRRAKKTTNVAAQINLKKPKADKN
ncbi:replication protein A 70 kDa DNA-binding subunit B-like [Solanum verrucosum]|uniref:replication protein A 70 kDa DNA-binding subunit B-like n=1 Tax=Solanum verrucosum TaxID=315347 RepID=UPI0020D16EEC|nr:replication protein A 70 kDa DNA-binding subunit B-like [Solanum verrucosum]